MARNKKINAIIAISLALAVVGFHFGTSKSRNDDAEWKNFLMENGPGPVGSKTMVQMWRHWTIRATQLGFWRGL